MSVVCVNNLCFHKSSYSEKVTILSNVNLIIQQPMVYGLLGPSGCGKTSLLRCLLGYNKPTSGSIELFGKRLGDTSLGIPGPNLGYTAQTNMLCKNLTPSEMLYFCGQLAMMEEGDIRIRVKELCIILELEKDAKPINELSGGQQRRIAVACALLAKPKFLILDEPTVGSDPMVRNRIWTILKNACKFDGSTVIISTHYFEEVTKADTIGIMRTGCLVAQDTPTKFAERWGVNSIEKALLCLFREIQKNGNSCNELSNSNLPNSNLPNSNLPNSNLPVTPDITIFSNISEPTEKRKQFSHDRSVNSKWHLLPTLIHRILWKQRSALLVPLLLSIFLSSFPTGISTLFIGRDPKNLSIGMVVEKNTDSNLTFTFVKHVNKLGLGVILFEEYESAKASAKNLSIAGFCSINPDFPDSFNQLLAEKRLQDIEGARLNCHLDHTNLFLSYYVEKCISKAYNNLIKTQASNLNVNPNITQFFTVDPVYGYIDDYKMWTGESSALLAISIAMIMASSLSITISWISDDQDSSLFERFRASNVDWLTVSLSYLISAGLITTVASQVSLTITRLIFPFDQHFNQPFVWHLIFGVTAFSASIVGLAIGRLPVESKMFHFALATGYTLSASISAGITNSPQSFPYYISWISNLFPVDAATQTLNAILVKGLQLSNPLVYSNLLFVVLHLLINIVLFSGLIKITY